MPKGSDLIGLPVLAGPDLHRAGRVLDIFVTPDGRRVCGLLIDAGNWFRPRRVLDYQAVRAVGETYVLAHDERFLTPDGHHRCTRQILGKPILDPTGDEMGTMDDLYFDATTGAVTALQISRGFVDDLLDGKQVLPAPDALLMGDQAILMAAEEWGDPPGGA